MLVGPTLGNSDVEKRACDKERGGHLSVLREAGPHKLSDSASQPPSLAFSFFSFKIRLVMIKPLT